MALEAMVFPQDPFGNSLREFWGYEFGGGKEAPVHGTLDTSCSSLVQAVDNGDVNSSSPETAAAAAAADEAFVACPKAAEAGERRKRRRSKRMKNQEEVENQRMTHIAVERNRRKQMNEYLAVLRSLMPASYVQRSDQASIIGGAINFVKELEKLVQTLEARKRIKERSNAAPFADFFTFPQYSYSSQAATLATSESTGEPPAAAARTENGSTLADIEVTMVDSHANLKVLSLRRPKQLLKMFVGLQDLHLTTLHLNVTTIEEMVLLSFSLKVEDECQLNSVDDIAAAVHQLIGRIQEESGFDRAE